MKRKLLISFIISFITVLGLSVSTQADTTTTQVTSNSYEDSMPQIKGDYLVWQGHVNGHWQIFLYSIENEKTTRITNNNYDSISPRTDGEYVVWFGACNQGGEVFQYNIATGETTKITNDSNLDSSPQIADGRVVWASHQVTGSVEPGEIKIYDINTGQHDQLTHTQQDDSSPRINSESVIWIQTDGADNSTLFIHDISQGTTQEAPEGFIWGDSPQTDGDLTVSMWNDGADWEIIVCKNGQNGFEQVTNNNLDDRYPGISGNYITWMAGEGNEAEIYVALFSSGSPDPNEAPKAVIEANPTSGFAVPLTVTFDAGGSSDSDGNIVEYRWDFGDGESGTGITTPHDFMTTGTYFVTLTVVDNEGATAQAQVAITVDDIGFMPMR
jgi:beta propeller repeat protein